MVELWEVERRLTVVFRRSPVWHDGVRDGGVIEQGAGGIRILCNKIIVSLYYFNRKYCGVFFKKYGGTYVNCNRSKGT